MHHGETSRRFRIRCLSCSAEYTQDVPVHQLRCYADGKFRPIECVECHEQAAVPTTRPYELNVNDRRFLRSIRILPDDDGSRAA